MVDGGLRRIGNGAIVCAFAALLAGCGTTKVAEGPPLDRVTRWNEAPEFRETSDAEVIEWLDSEAPVNLTRCPEDRLPNGLAAVMAPFLVDWERSNLDGGEEGYVLINNVQVGGNPVLGVSLDATVRLPLNAVERVEFVIVRYHLEGLAKTSGHVQLRFVFAEDRRPVVLAPDGTADPRHDPLDDLVMSWEAWRPPLTRFSFTQGLAEEDGYTLTARMYTGGQRFLQDGLRGAVWDCYPLALPDHPDSAETVLFAGLIMGDGAARRVISDVIDAEERKEDSRYSKKQLRRTRGAMNWEQVPDDMLVEYMKQADVSYNTFQRSCISVTLSQIDAAVERLRDEYDLGTHEPIRAGVAEIPRWFDDVRAGDTWGVIKRGPGALWWILRNKELLPYKAYVPLEDAGLLRLDERGKPIMYRYRHDGASPYGALNRNAM